MHMNYFPVLLASFIKKMEVTLAISLTTLHTDKMMLLFYIHVCLLPLKHWSVKNDILI